MAPNPRDYVERLLEFFALYLKESFPKIGVASENLFRVVMIFINHLQRQCEHQNYLVSFYYNAVSEESDMPAEVGES